MMGLIIDDNKAFVEGLKSHLKTIESKFSHFNRDLAINYENDSTYEIAQKIIRSASDEDVLILINVELRCRSGLRQEQAGVEVLKFLRLIDEFAIRDPTGKSNGFARKAHCLMYSMRSSVQLLTEKPTSAIILSSGVSTAQVPNDFDGLSFSQLAETHVNLNSLQPFFRMDFLLPDSRHSWANWWGIKQLWDVHKLVTNSPGRRYPERVEAEMKKLQTREAAFLFGSSKVDLSMEIRKQSPEINEQLAILRKRMPQIMQIDDKWEDGWTKTVLEIVYGKQFGEVERIDSGHFTDINIQGQRALRVFTNFGPQNARPRRLEEMLQSLEASVAPPPQVFLLDLRLFNESDLGANVSDLSGSKVLGWLRRTFPGVPVVVTTASNKAWSLEYLMALGADAYWTKQGVDERRTPQETVQNYLALLKKLTRVTDDDYQFLSRFLAKFELALIATNPWWAKKVWTTKRWGKRTTTARVDILRTILNDTALMIRSYLQRTSAGKSSASPLAPSVILRHAALVLEEIHRFDKLPAEKQDRQQLISRQDWFGNELYRQRNLASHLDGISQVSWNTNEEFLANLICYLTYGPENTFVKGDSLQNMRASAPTTYEALFREIIS